MKNDVLTMLTVMALLWASNTHAQTNWMLGGQNVPTAGGVLGSNNNRPIIFETNNTERGRIQNESGFWGLGTGAPKTKLHVSLGNTGLTPAANTTLTIENTGNNFLSMLTQSNNESGVLFGNPFRSVDGGIFYNGPLSPRGMELRTNGNIARMTITNAGDIGIGAAPGSFKMKVRHNNFGFALEDAGSGNHWEFLSSGVGMLQLFHNDKFMGEFDRASGEYRAISDVRRKTNIQSMQAVLKQINELKPVMYQYENAGSQQQYYGFIAQDVEKIFPNLVSHVANKERNTDTYTLNYSGFGILAVKGIQELIKLNEEKNAQLESQQKQLDALQQQIDTLKAIIFNGSQVAAGRTKLIIEEPVKTVVLGSPSLAQNIPNPFSNTTAIQYVLPQKYTTAQIMIADSRGKTIKQIIISGSGKGILQVDASTLSAGVYHYSLVVNGKVTSTRQMIVTK